MKTIKLESNAKETKIEIESIDYIISKIKINHLDENFTIYHNDTKIDMIDDINYRYT
jgi:hypothetical protein